MPLCGSGGKALCMADISLPLSQGFSTLHDIDAFRCSVAEISDNLAGVLMSCIYRKFLSINVLHPMSITKSSAKLSDK